MLADWLPKTIVHADWLPHPCPSLSPLLTLTVASTFALTAILTPTDTRLNQNPNPSPMLAAGFKTQGPKTV